MTTRWARFARGWVVALFSTFLAALSHTLGGGAVPGQLAVVVSLAFAGIVCVGLAGKTQSFWRVLVSVLLSQLVFHGLFSLGAAPGGLVMEPSATMTTDHDHAVVNGLVAATSAGAGQPDASAHAPGHGAAMWLAHLAAAIVTIAALRYGERAFWGLFETARLVIRTLLRPGLVVLTPPAPQSTPTTARVFVPRDLRILLSPMRRRGPPRCTPVAPVAFPA